jgi:hypothetical protein
LTPIAAGASRTSTEHRIAIRRRRETARCCSRRLAPVPSYCGSARTWRLASGQRPWCRRGPGRRTKPRATGRWSAAPLPRVSLRGLRTRPQGLEPALNPLPGGHAAGKLRYFLGFSTGRLRLVPIDLPPTYRDQPGGLGRVNGARG